MTPFLLNHGTAPIALPTHEMQLLNAELRALRQARDAVAGDVTATYGRIDGLVLEREEALCACYHAHLQSAGPLTQAEQGAQASLRG